MNTTIGTTTGKIIGTTIAACACFTFAACGSEIPAPAQDIGGAQSRQSDAPTQPAKSATPRKDFGDEFGNAKPRPKEAGDSWKGSGNRIDFRDWGR